LKTYISKKQVIAPNPGLIPEQAAESGYFIPPLAGLDPDFRRGDDSGDFLRLHQRDGCLRSNYRPNKEQEEV
jgi:hypothetical protein